MPQSRYIVQRSLWPDLWEDWEGWINKERALESAASWTKHREDGTGPNAHYRVIHRTEELIEAN